MPEITRLETRLLDLREAGRYLQRLTMHGLEPHNRSASPPTTSGMPSPTAPFSAPIQMIQAGEPGFPEALRRLPRPVKALWVAGTLPRAEQPAVAMVGSRAATRTACSRTEAMAAALAKRGHAVISGGALGIDAAAHRGALAAGGATFAVLGCGADVVYPDRHAALFAEIASTGTGGLLSEYPPGTPPRDGHFPVRNRIVAALAQAVVVVEARPRSGALITARLARELGRPLYAVPGSAGTDQLIGAGLAAPIEDAASLLAQMAGAPPPVVAVPESLRALVEALGAGKQLSIPETAKRLGITLSDALGRLAEAELGGWVRRLPGGRFEVSRGH